MSTLTNTEDPDEMPHFCGISSVSSLFAQIYTINRDWI